MSPLFYADWNIIAKVYTGEGNSVYDDQGSGSQTSILDANYIPALLRYKWYILITTIPLIVIAGIIVASLPPIYLSAGTVMVETQKIPQSLVQTTVTTAVKERIDIIKQRVMTRDRLLSVIRQHGYFQLDESSPIQVNQVITNVRRSVLLEVEETRVGREKSVIAFRVGFESREPRIAYEMANDLVTLFMSENIKVRTERASETTEFFRQEAAKVKSELDKTEAAVAEYKQKNKDALPEHLRLYGDMRAQATEKLNNINRDIRSARQQIELIKTQMALAQPGEGVDGVYLDPRLSQLQQRYKELSMLYKPDYPDLVALREQIELLKSNPLSQEDIEQAPVGDLSVASKLDELEQEIASLQMDRKETEESIADLENRILKVPLVERGLIELNRDYDAKLSEYNQLAAKIGEASRAESLEQEMLAEKFSLLEPPRLPRVPSAPNRIKLMAMGVIVAFGAPIGIALLIGHFDSSIRSRKVLERAVSGRRGLPVLEVNYIRTEAESSGQRRRIRKSFIIAMAGLLLAALIFHFFVMDVGDLMEKVLERFGIFIY
ncbi:hypothetical protein [Teredinibacter turnerae]|uniref:hypothetical protein n=1 Tax=Teredinibacter turnerae TaxID=2426 RepID=UPI001E4D648E|nr:hypothetical protein [Teredinibacter turnerae]